MSTYSKQKTTHLSTQSHLPDIIDTYISSANDGKIDKAAECSAVDALVHDENQDIRGAEAIRIWISQTTKEFHPKNEVKSVSGEKNNYTVVSKISGNFPGSPVDLEFHYVISNGKITHLDIQ